MAEFINFIGLMIKGRNSTLISRRNQKLILRYYYWYDLKRRRLDDVIDILSESEFYLKPYTIREIIRNNTELLKKIRKERPVDKNLEFYRWSTN